MNVSRFMEGMLRFWVGSFFILRGLFLCREMGGLQEKLAELEFLSSWVAGLVAGALALGCVVLGCFVLMGYFMKVPGWALALGPGLFLVGSGAIKLQDLEAFTEAVQNYQFTWIERPWDGVIAYTLPWLEIFGGLALLVRWTRPGGVVVVVVMLLVFCGALGSAWERGLEINCGCFSKSDEPTLYWLKILENLSLAFVVLLSTGFFWRGTFRDDRIAVRAEDANLSA